MSIIGIDKITYGVLDLPLCKRYFEEWGLRLVSEDLDQAELVCQNGSCIRLVVSGKTHLTAGVEADPTIREIVWGVETQQDLDTIFASLSAITEVTRTASGFAAVDPNGLAVRFQISIKQPIPPATTLFNTWGNNVRVDQNSAFYEQAVPVNIAHAVFRVKNVAEVEKWYTVGAGFRVTDRYPDRGIFLRCSPNGSHHNMFFIQVPDKEPGLDHVAFAVRDIHEIFGGGVRFARKGWSTELGPGRHPISSAYFWYFKCPAGGRTEYSGDEDYYSANWVEREFAPIPQNFAEWAANGDVDVQMKSRGGSVAAAESRAAAAPKKT